MSDATCTSRTASDHSSVGWRFVGNRTHPCISSCIINCCRTEAFRRCIRGHPSLPRLWTSTQLKPQPTRWRLAQEGKLRSGSSLMGQLLWSGSSQASDVFSECPCPCRFSCDSPRPGCDLQSSESLASPPSLCYYRLAG